MVPFLQAPGSTKLLPISVGRDAATTEVAAERNLGAE